MDENEAARQAALHKAAALHRLGPEEGAGATIWARVVADSLTLHEAARERFAENSADLESWERLNGTALVLVVAIDQALAFERRVSRLTDDPELAEARARFDAVARHTEALRDLVAHLDAYAVGEGHRQTGKREPAIREKYLSRLIYWSNGGGTHVNLGDEQINVRTAARAAIELARVVEQVRAKHLALAGREADEAFRRMYLPADE
jgi:hypothetical protein